MFIKQGQRREVLAQCRDVPEGLFTNDTTLSPTSRCARESIKPTSKH